MHPQRNAGLMTSAPEAKTNQSGFPHQCMKLRKSEHVHAEGKSTKRNLSSCLKSTTVPLKCHQGAVDVVVFVVEVVVVEVVVERCSVKTTVAVSTSMCVTTSVIVVGFLEPSASSSTEVFVVVVVDVAAAVVGAAVVAAADVVGATVSAAVVAGVVAATVVSAASGSCLLALDLKT